jgi:hypothetical protein
MGDDIPRAWAAILELEELSGVVRAVGIFEKAGVLPPEEAAAWREAVRARLAELSEPVAAV